MLGLFADRRSRRKTPCQPLAMALALDPAGRAFHSLDHGDAHWRCVAALGMELAREAGLDPMPMAIFGALHDRFRWNEHDDPQHGPRAAEAARHAGILTALGPLGNAMAQALVHHDQGMTSADPFIERCWDADRLTLMRVGIMPSLEFMSSIASDSDLDAWIDRAWAVMDAPPSWEEIARIALGCADRRHEGAGIDAEMEP